MKKLILTLMLGGFCIAAIAGGNDGKKSNRLSPTNNKALLAKTKKSTLSSSAKVTKNSPKALVATGTIRKASIAHPSENVKIRKSK